MVRKRWFGRDGEERREREASEVETRGSCLAPGPPCSLKQSRRMPPTLADLLCHSETCIPGAGFPSLSYPLPAIRIIAPSRPARPEPGHKVRSLPRPPLTDI